MVLDISKNVNKIKLASETHRVKHQYKNNKLMEPIIESCENNDY